MAILHFQRFGINIDEGFPEPNEDGTYPNSDDDNADSEKPDEIDEMVTDQDVDPETDEAQLRLRGFSVFTGRVFRGCWRRPVLGIERAYACP